MQFFSEACSVWMHNESLTLRNRFANEVRMWSLSDCWIAALSCSSLLLLVGWHLAVETTVFCFWKILFCSIWELRNLRGNQQNSVNQKRGHLISWELCLVTVRCCQDRSSYHCLCIVYTDVFMPVCLRLCSCTHVWQNSFTDWWHVCQLLTSPICKMPSPVSVMVSIGWGLGSVLGHVYEKWSYVWQGVRTSLWHWCWRNCLKLRTSVSLSYLTRRLWNCVELSRLAIIHLLAVVNKTQNGLR